MISKEEFLLLLQKTEKNPDTIDKLLKIINETEKETIINLLDENTSNIFLNLIREELNVLNNYIYDIFKIYKNGKITSINLETKETYPLIVKYFIELSQNLYDKKDYYNSFKVLENITKQIKMHSFPTKEHSIIYFKLLYKYFIRSNNFFSAINSLYRINKIENKQENTKNKNIIEDILEIKNENKYYKKYFCGLELYNINLLKDKINLDNIEVNEIWNKVIENCNKELNIIENIELFSFAMINNICERRNDHFIIKNIEDKIDLEKRIFESIEEFYVKKIKEIKVEKKEKVKEKVVEKVQPKKIVKKKEEIDYFTKKHNLLLLYNKLVKIPEEEDISYEERNKKWNERCKRKEQEINKQIEWFNENKEEIEEMGKELEELRKKSAIEVERVQPTVTLVKERRSWRTEMVEEVYAFNKRREQKEENRQEGSVYTFVRNRKWKD